MQCNAVPSPEKVRGCEKQEGEKTLLHLTMNSPAEEKRGLDCYKMSTTYFPSSQFALVYVHSTKEEIGIMTNKTMFSTQIYHNAQFCAQLTHPQQWSPG